MDIGRRVREVREELGMQRTVLARRVGVAENTIYRIETGKRTPSVEVLEKIARELRTEPAEFLREPVPLAEAPPDSSLGEAGVGRAEEELEVDRSKDRAHWDRVLASVRERQRNVEATVGEVVASEARNAREPRKADLSRLKWALDEAQKFERTLLLALPGSYVRHSSTGQEEIAGGDLFAIEPDQWEEVGKAQRFYTDIVERLVQAGLVEIKERPGQKPQPTPVNIGA